MISKKFQQTIKPISNVLIRKAELKDLPLIINLENKMWSVEQRCSEETFIKRLSQPQNGFLIAETESKNIIGTFFCVRKTYLPNVTNINWHNDSSTYDKNGNAYFGVSVTVDAQAPKGTLRSLFNGWRQLAKNDGLSYIYGGSRIPGLKIYNGRVEEYVQKVKKSEHFDIVLSKYIACDLKVGRILPNYFKDDESLNFGIEVYDCI